MKVSNIYERNIQSDLRITEVKGINKTHQREFRERDINVKVFRKDNIYFPSYVDLFFPLTQARRKPILTLCDDLDSSPVYSGVRVAHLLRFLCCIFFFYLSSICSLCHMLSVSLPFVFSIVFVL